MVITVAIPINIPSNSVWRIKRFNLWINAGPRKTVGMIIRGIALVVNRHKSISLVALHFEGTVHGDLKVVGSQTVSLRVTVGEEAT